MSVLTGDAGSNTLRFARFLLFIISSSVFLISDSCWSLAIPADVDEGRRPAG
jgi:hypothetical protein